MITLQNTTINEAQLKTFADTLHGELIRPGDETYNEARAVWNGMIDRYPAFIVRCANTDDVVAAVNFAQYANLTVAVRGGGHNVAGHGTIDGGLVIDMSPMNRVHVNPEARTARAGGGTTIGELDRATQQHNLAVPMGVVTATGIAGLTLGGGFGWLRNKYGLSCDNLIAAEVVTAAGQVVHTSETKNPELLWGLRGGGGNFGIVTAFEYRAYALGPEVFLSAVFHDGRNMKEVLQFFREYSAAVPDEISLLAVCGQFPPGSEVFPEEVQGLPFVAFIGVYAGSVEEGEKVTQPLREFSQPLVDFSGVVPYLEAQQFFDEDYPDGMRYYWKSLNLYDLSDAAIDRITEHALNQPSPLTTVDIWYNGGAIRRVAEDDTAFSGRQNPFLLNVESNWKNPQDDELNLSWSRTFVHAMQEFSDGSRYFNFAGFQEEGEAAMITTFGAKYQRMVALKTKYDPTNFFSKNQNIKPGV